MKKQRTKKEIVSICLALALIGTTQGFAATVNTPVIDVEKNTVSISGKADKAQKKLELMVLNPNGELSSIEENAAEGLQYQRVIYSDENGDFSHTFKLNLDGNNDTGTYTVYIGGNAVLNTLKTDFYFASAAETEALIDSITDETDSSKLATILKNENNTKTLSLISFAPFVEQNGQQVAKVLISMIEGWTEKEKQECTPAKMQRAIYEASVVSAYNNGLKDMVIDADGKFLYDEVIGFSKLDEDYSVTLYEVYNSSISKTGKESIKNALFDNQYSNTSDLKKGFMEHIVLKGLTNPEKNGFAHVDKILTQNNAKAVGLTLKALTDDNKISIKEEKEYKTIDDLQRKINSLSTTTTSGALGGSSGSSGSNKKPASNVGSFVIDNSNNPQEKTDIIPGQKEVFEDMESFSWAKPAVEELYKKGIINGVNDKEFNPSGVLTREQAVKILCEALGQKPVEATEEFSDVDKEAWYAGYIAAAKELGLVNGISESEFGVGCEISRQDFAVMITRAFKLSSEESKNDFVDFNEISDYAREAVGILGSKKIINGYSDNTFKPLGNCTRAEAAVIIYRALGGNA